MEKPILFSTAMVQAILDGMKTQTRRVIKPQPSIMPDGWITHHRPQIMYPTMGAFIARKCPYNADILWVRETWQDMSDNEGDYVYLADGKEGLEKAGLGVLTTDDIKWKPSIFMPRKAARMFLAVKNVRVERLQDITEEDIKAEGIDIGTIDTEKYLKSAAYRMLADNLPKARFGDLWDSINKDRGYGWDINPWVWVVEFQKQ